MKGRQTGELERGNLTVESALAILGGGKRYEIVGVLLNGPHDVGTIAQVLELPINLISHHLAILKRFGFVYSTTIGLRHLYALAESVRGNFRRDAMRLVVKLNDRCRISIVTRDPRAVRTWSKPM